MIEKTGEESATIFEETTNASFAMPEEDRNRVFKVQKEKSSYEEVKNKLRLANNEIEKLKKRERIYVEEKVKFERMKGLWELEKNPNPELIDSQDQFFIYTLPAIKEAKFIRMVLYDTKTLPFS